MSIELKDVAVRYIVGDFRHIGFKDYIIQKMRGQYKAEEFWAVDGVSFRLERGDFLGIIGTNGAGKSTLLKAVSGIMLPTRGNLSVQGSVAALLELGSGFDAEMTVRENTFLRGALMGYTRAFMNEMYDEIIDFAELEDFQDRPFNHLSSGMQSRLAFSIACLVRPEILILDEVLSVGDGAFKQKSEAKMQELLQFGATTLFVSHSTKQVKQMCNKLLWLDKGKQMAFGEVEEICDKYEEFLEEKSRDSQWRKNQELANPKKIAIESIEIDTKNKVMRQIMSALPANKETVNIADEILSGENLYVFKGLTDKKIPFDMNNFKWEMKVTKSPNSYSLYLHCLNHVLFLIGAYRHTKEVKYIELADKFLRSWGRNYNHTTEKLKYHQTMAWTDHATATRSENILAYVLVVLEDKINIDIAYLYPEIQRHAAWLNNAENYTLNHNHGIFQDVALYKLGIFLSEKKYCDKATERFKEQLRYAYPFRTHIENSMTYVVLMKNLIHSAKEVFDSAEINELAENIYKKTADFLVCAYRPDLTLPAYGDTAGIISYKIDIPGETPPEFKYVMSKGAEGKKPESNVCVFKEDGFAFLRSSYEYEKEHLEQASWLMLRSGFNCLTHKHRDELSVVWWAKGRDILIDPGMYNYVSGDVIRAYMNGVSAHSTVSVDNKDYALPPENIDNLITRAGMLENMLENGRHRFRAYNNLYDGVNIERSLINFDENTLIIIDNIVSGDIHEYTQIFHLAENIDVQSSQPEEAVAKVSEEWNLSVRQLIAADSVKVVRGQNSENSEMSLRSTGLNKAIPTSSILFSAQSSNYRFVTILQLFREKDDLFESEIKDDYLCCAGEKFVITSQE